MLSRLADRIALHLQTQKVIDPEEYELYQFGVRKLLSDIINMVSVVLIGILMDEIVACIVFSLAFRLIRPYAGGYHARTPMRCYLLSMGVLMLSLSAIKYVEINTYIFSVITIWSVAGICILAPVEAENNPLDEVERGVYRRRTWLVCGLEMSAILICACLHWDVAVKSIVCVFVDVAISMVVGHAIVKK